MRSIVFQIILAILLFSLSNVMNGEKAMVKAEKMVSSKTIYLTLQADYGSFRQVTEIDGTNTIYFKPLDLINVNTILLNGSDVTSELVKNHFSLPALSKNSTLYITFEIEPTNYYQKNYNTISFQSVH